MPLVDKYSLENKWTYLSKYDLQEIKNNLTLLVDSDRDIESAKVFDLKVFYIMLSMISDTVVAKKAIEQVVRISQALLERLSIPQVAQKKELLLKITTQTYWNTVNLENLEHLRNEIRYLLQYIKDEIEVYETDFKDELIDQGNKNVNLVDFKTYEEKVMDYLLSNSYNETICKIKMLDKITSDDLKELERILWHELGTKNDYFNVTKEENLAVFIRSIVGIDQDAINNKFSQYLNSNVLSSKQQDFVKNIINYVRQNGDITKQDLVEKSPFRDLDVIEEFSDNIDVLLIVINNLHDSILVA